MPPHVTAHTARDALADSTACHMTSQDQYQQVVQVVLLHYVPGLLARSRLVQLLLDDKVVLQLLPTESAAGEQCK